MQKGADRVAFVNAVLGLPPRQDRASGLWPGQAPVLVDGLETCAVCGVDAETLARESGDDCSTPAKVTNFLRKHTFRCARDAAVEEMGKAVVAALDNEQDCPVCLQAGKTDQRNRSERSPGGWSAHVDHHIDYNSYKCCGVKYPTGLLLGEHLLAHGIFSMKATANKPDALCVERLPTPPYCLDTCTFFVDPRGWTLHVRDYLFPTYINVRNAWARTSPFLKDCNVGRAVRARSCGASRRLAIVSTAAQRVSQTCFISIANVLKVRWSVPQH